MKIRGLPRAFRATDARPGKPPADSQPVAAPASSRSTGYIRLGGGLALAALAAITAVISYQHGLDVVHATGSKDWVAYLVPLVADLMIFASSLALLDAAQNGLPRPRLAMLSLAVGIAATLAMNVASGWRHGTGGALVSALAPVALVLSYETLMGMIRRSRDHAPEPAAEAAPEPVAACPHRLPGTVEDAALTAFLHGRDCVGDGPSMRQVAADFGIHRNRLSALVREHDQPATDNSADDTPRSDTPALPPATPQPPAINGHDLAKTGSAS